MRIVCRAKGLKAGRNSFPVSEVLEKLILGNMQLYCASANLLSLCIQVGQGGRTV